LKSFRFVHTADIHLDSPLKGLSGHEGRVADRIRTATREAFDSLIGQTIHEEADFIIIAGDLFDGEWRDYHTGLFFASPEAREYYGTASLNFDRVVQDGSTVILLTWRGDWANDALALLLCSIGLTSWNEGIVVRVKSTSTSDLREALIRIATMGTPDPAELRLNLATLLQEKWDWALPHPVLVKSFISTRMDFEGARRSAEELANAAASS
jgi:hypothetical protein